MVQQSNQFDILAAELSSHERRQMLATIRASMEKEAAPIAAADEPEPPRLEEHIKSLGMFDRIRLFLTQLFTSRTREEVVQGWIVRSLGDMLVKRKVDGIDARGRKFEESFAADVERLQQMAVRLFSEVELSVNRRTELVLGLAMHHFPGVHQELVRETGEPYVRSLKEDNERFLKRKLVSTMEGLIGDIPSSSRTGMTMALNQVDTLYRLAGFSFGRILGSFEKGGGDNGRSCAFDYVTRNVEQLQNILSALRDPVDLALLETLIILNLDSDEARSDEGLFQQAIRDRLSDITEVLGVFRRFSERYPLTLILRLIKDDPWWNPRPERTGEDWSQLYRTFFLDRVQSVVIKISLEGSIRTEMAKLKELTEVSPSPVIGLPDGTNGVHSRFWFQCVAVKMLTDRLHGAILRNLRIVLTGGEFYKSSNRAQFNDAYNEFEMLPRRVAALEKKLEPNGAWGTVVWGDHVIGERRKMAHRIDQDVVKVVEAAQNTVEMLVNILGGILYARPGSVYDTLANYGQIGGRRNAETIDELKETYRCLQSFMGILGELGAVEKRASDNELVLDTKLVRKNVNS